MELSKNYNKVLEGLKAFGYDDLEDLPAKTKELLLCTITVTEVLTLTDVVGQSEQLAAKNFDCFEYSQGFHRCFEQCKKCKGFS